MDTHGSKIGAKISEGRGRPWGIFFGFYKTRHILLSDSPNCTVLHAVVLTQYRRVTDGQSDRQTDGQTDGIAVASTASTASIAARCKNVALSLSAIGELFVSIHCVANESNVLLVSDLNWTLCDLCSLKVITGMRQFRLE